MKRAIKFWRERETRWQPRTCGLQRLALMFLVCLSLIGGPYPGLGEEPAVSIGVTLGFPGRTTVVPVNAYNITNVVAAQFDFTYDTSHISLNGVQPPASLS